MLEINTNSAKGNSGTVLAFVGLGVVPYDVEEMVCPTEYVNETVIASSPPAANSPSVGPQIGEHAEVVEDNMT